MHTQLQEIVDEFAAALERLGRLVATVPEAEWTRRPEPQRWSVSECVAHLNLTSAAYIPLLKEGLARARSLGSQAPKRYRRDLVGWLLWKYSGPPVRMRVNTPPSFVPTSCAAPKALVEEFARLQDAQIACVKEADGLPIHRVRITSAFNTRLKYNLFAGFTILPRHQHQHLWQAEQAALTIGGFQSRN
jgi:hypothetical protein